MTTARNQSSSLRRTLALLSYIHTLARTALEVSRILGSTRENDAERNST
jgi:hypothetical protein